MPLTGTITPGAAAAIPRRVTHVIFDFDGTLSWLRRGWPDIMTALFLEYMPPAIAPAGSVLQGLRRDILQLNGKPSIHQVAGFSEWLLKAGGPLLDPGILLSEYQRRLAATVSDRIGRLTGGQAQGREFVLPGAFDLLEQLRRAGFRLTILSGTAEREVKREAGLLGLAEFFGEHVYGSTHAGFSKKDVIERILREEGVSGTEILAFGDGPVEIEFAKAVGGVAIGVASDETGSEPGGGDPVKKELLLAAGADAIIPDYRGVQPVLEKLIQ